MCNLNFVWFYYLPWFGYHHILHFAMVEEQNEINNYRTLFMLLSVLEIWVWMNFEIIQALLFDKKYTTTKRKQRNGVVQTRCLIYFLTNEMKRNSFSLRRYEFIYLFTYMNRVRREREILLSKIFTSHWSWERDVRT